MQTVQNNVYQRHQSQISKKRGQEDLIMILLPLKIVCCVRRQKTSGYVSLAELQAFEASKTLIYAAEIRNDAKVLPAMKDQNVMVLEVKYHGNCYRDYSNAKTLDRIKIKNKQENEKRGTKVKGGIIGFSTSQNTVQRWMLTAHEWASATRNFKSIIGIRDEENEVHADNTTSRISRDENDVNKVIQVIKGWCNPFEDVSEFACLSSGLTVDDDIVQGLLGAKDIGETAARDFINKSIVTNEVGFYEALPKKRLKTFESARMKRSVIVAGK